jgi:hypothetical protein
VTTLQRHKYLILLLTLVSVLTVQSFPHPAMFAAMVLAPVSILAVLLVVFTGWRERAVAFGVAAAAIAGNWGQFVAVPGEYQTLQAAIHDAVRVLFPSFAVAVILRNIFAEKAIAADQVLGAVCGYLLAAAAWAHVYALVEILLPGSFAMSPELTTGRSGGTAVRRCSITSAW